MSFDPDITEYLRGVNNVFSIGKILKTPNHSPGSSP